MCRGSIVSHLSWSALSSSLGVIGLKLHPERSQPELTH